MQVRLRGKCFTTVLITAAAACGSPTVGGQSGTDGQSGMACPVTDERLVGVDEVTTRGSAAQLRARAEQALTPGATFDLSWTPQVGGVTTLTIEVLDWGAATFRDSQDHVCDDLSVEATLRFTTADGVLDETMVGEFRNTQWVGGHRDDALSRSAIAEHLTMSFSQQALGLESFGAFIELEDGRTWGELIASADVNDFAVAQALSVLAHFESVSGEGAGPTRLVARDDPYMQPPAFLDACSEAHATESAFRAFSSNDELVGALVGSWILCTSTSTNAVPHNGIVWSQDGTWRHLVDRDGRLIEQLGFGHEGTYEVIDTSIVNGPNARQLNLERFPQEVAFSSDRRTMHLLQSDGGYPNVVPSYDNMYVRSGLTIAPPELQHSVGERAGAGSCSEGEAFVHGFQSIEALRSALIGSWTFCRGGLRDGASAITFAADHTYVHLDGGGGALATGRYELLDTSIMNGEGATQVNMVDDDAPADRSSGAYSISHPLLSDAPVKLWMRGDADSVLSALP